MTESNSNALLSNGFYNKLKFTVTILLPAVGTLYGAIALIWNLQYSGQVIGTTSALALFLGTLIGISSSSYNSSSGSHGANAFDGTMIVKESPPGQKTFSLSLNKDPMELESQDQIVFNVKHTDDDEDSLSVQEIANRVQKED